MKRLVGVLCIYFFVFTSNAQTKEDLIEINKTWEKFYNAFEYLDYSLMAEIHSKDLIRISGGQSIVDYESYINNYKRRFQQNKDAGISYNISLRFFERINNKTTASERGVYQLIVNKGKPEEQKYYGQFHVILKKVNDKWYITMDYDSSEGNTIDEEDYLRAHAIEDISAFLN